MPKKSDIDLAKKVGTAACYVLGSYLVIFNLFAFKLTKAGNLYYPDPNQHWLAGGAVLLICAWLIRNWQKI